MSQLNAELISSLIEEAAELLSVIQGTEADNTLEALALYENKTTLEAFLKCLSVEHANPELFYQELKNIFADRWEKICDSSMSYTTTPFHAVNQFCLKLAQALSESINSQEPNSGPYFILMPTLKTGATIYSPDPTADEIHDLGLHEFIVSDNHEVFIPVFDVLHDASLTDNGRLRHQVSVDTANVQLLTTAEQSRLENHSTEANKLYKAVIEYNHDRLVSGSFSARLRQLVTALLAGGAASRVVGGGAEEDSGANANEGIIEFFKYWDEFPEGNRTNILKKDQRLGELFGRLRRPDHERYQDSSFCVELIAGGLSRRISLYEEEPRIKGLKKKLSTDEQVLQSALANKSLTMIHHPQAPKKILHLIHQLPLSEQEKIFKDQPVKTALSYAANYALDELPLFTLNEEEKRYIREVKIGGEQNCILIEAAMQGKTAVVDSLLDWGVPIESRSDGARNALHWAAYFGYQDTVEQLLDRDALIDAVGEDSATALDIAIANRRNKVAQVLLDRGASIAIERGNILHYAKIYNPSFVGVLLEKIASLPINQQAAFIQNIPYPYNINQPNILMYAASLGALVLTKVMNSFVAHQTNEDCKSLFALAEYNGKKLIHHVAISGASECVALLAGHEIQIDEYCQAGCTALHYAAQNGHATVINELIQHNANLNARSNGSTALVLAMQSQKTASVRALLKFDPELSTAAINENALDLALNINLGWENGIIDALLVHLAAKQPKDKSLFAVGQPCHRSTASILKYVINTNPFVFKRLLTDRTGSKEALDEASKLTKLLRELNFDTHLQMIWQQHDRFTKRLFSQKYERAHEASKELLIKCVEAKIKLFQDEGPVEARFEAFKETCKLALQESEPVLKEHREITKFVAQLLLAIIGFPITIALSCLGLFTLNTKSKQLLDAFDESLAQPLSMDAPAA